MNTMYLSYFDKDKSIPFYIQYGSHDTDLYMHTHADFTELVVVLNGTAMHKVDNESYFIKKGDVFVISNNTAHGYEKTHEFRICNIMFSPETLLTFHADIRKITGFHALFVIEPYLTKEHNFQSRLKLKLDDFNDVNTLITLMIQEYSQKKDGFKTMMQAQFMMLVVLLSRAYSMTSISDDSYVINIAKSVSYIDNHYTEILSIHELAALSNFSVRHFARIFHETYQTTPSKYILSLRMQHACLLLKNSTLTISEIAFQSGFRDSNYFTRQFRSLFQLTPKQYRNLNRPSTIL